MSRLVLLLGSNLGNKKGNLDRARQLLNRAVGRIDRISAVHDSSPWGFDHPEDFANQVVVVSTRMAPEHVLFVLKKIERHMGRAPTTGAEYEARIIDIDILYYGVLVMNKPHLQIPHRLLPQRTFALVPLVEVLADFKHPVLKQTSRHMLQASRLESIES